MDCVIVDANVAFKTLVAGRGDLRSPLSPPRRSGFSLPAFCLSNFSKHKDRLLHASRLTEDELLQGLYTLVSRIEFINETDVPLGTWMEAHRLCRDLDEKDTPYVALTLHLEGWLWTEDVAEKRLAGGWVQRIFGGLTQPGRTLIGKLVGQNHRGQGQRHETKPPRNRRKRLCRYIRPRLPLSALSRSACAPTYPNRHRRFDPPKSGCHTIQTRNSSMTCSPRASWRVSR